MAVKARLRLIAWNVLLALLLLEPVARLLLSRNNEFAERPSYNLRYAPSGFSRQVLLPGQEIVALDDEGRPRRDLRRYRINRWGWRGDDWPLAKEPGELRVVFLGGSHVFDLHCEDAAGCPGWPAMVEKELAARMPGRRVRVLNGGAPGQDSRSFPAQLTLEWSRFAPDLVVFDSTWNDLKWINRFDPAKGQLGALPGAPPNPLIEARPGLDAWLGWSVVYRKLRDHYWERELGLREGQLEGRPQAAATAAAPEQGFALHGRLLRASAAAAIALGARPIVAVEERLAARDNDADEKRVIQLAMIGVASHEELLRLYEQADALYAGLAADHLVVDLNPVLAPDRARLFRDHVHTTPEGSRRLAELWAQRLADFLATPPSPATP